MEGGYHKKGQSLIIFRSFCHSPDQPLVEGAALRVLLIGFPVFENEKIPRRFMSQWSGHKFGGEAYILPVEIADLIKTVMNRI